ncbi:MAG: small ribosomal subunit biogenesis GTPase RsgA [Gammaproteobacteria bacterium]
MTKRKISKQQHLRIQKLQAERIARADKKTQAVEDLSNLGPEQSGLLITHHGKYVDVEAEDGTIYRCNIRQHLGALIAGDQVIWQPGPEQTGIVVALIPRLSLLWRPGFRDNIKPIAANIDQIFVVLAPQPKPTFLMLDSYLAATGIANIKTHLLCHKMDLLTNTSADEFAEIVSIYRNIGYQIYHTSLYQPDAWQTLKEALRNQNSIFVGQSGVGKSALIQYLVPKAKIEVGKLSLQQSLGAHTTVRSELYHLPFGGNIIDSPGIREFSLGHIEPHTLAKGFLEFLPYIKACKFSNCLHRNEPDCAVINAVHQGQISQIRWQNYLSLIEK